MGAAGERGEATNKRERSCAARGVGIAFFVSRYACMGFDLVKRDVRKGAKMSQVIEEE